MQGFTCASNRLIADRFYSPPDDPSPPLLHLRPQLSRTADRQLESRASRWPRFLPINFCVATRGLNQAEAVQECGHIRQLTSPAAMTWQKFLITGYKKSQEGNLGKEMEKANL